jgi:hypothetical protein
MLKLLIKVLVPILSLTDFDCVQFRTSSLLIYVRLYSCHIFVLQAAHTDFEAAARVVAYVTPFVNANGSDGEEFVRDTGDFVSVRLTAAAAGRMLDTQVSESWKLGNS